MGGAQADRVGIRRAAGGRGLEQARAEAVPRVPDCGLGSVPWRTLQEHLWTPVPRGQQDWVHVCPLRLEEVLLCGLLLHILRPPPRVAPLPLPHL